MVLLGLLPATIGMYPLTGVLRFTHGAKHLYDGLGFVPIAMGAFGMGEILSSTRSPLSAPPPEAELAVSSGNISCILAGPDADPSLSELCRTLDCPSCLPMMSLAARTRF